MGRRGALLAFTALILGTMFAGTADANHANPPNPFFGYVYTYRWLYPEDSGLLFWKAWTVDEEAVPLREALLLINAVENSWEAMFNYVLLLAGVRPFNFFGLGHHATADVKYARMNTTAQVQFFCQGGSTACLFPDAVYYDPVRDIFELEGSFIVYGPIVSGASNAVFQHVVAHEWGHGFGLAHHNNVCGFVMSAKLPLQCTNMPVGADIVTALDTVYGY